MSDAWRLILSDVCSLIVLTIAEEAMRIAAYKLPIKTKFLIILYLIINNHKLNSNYKIQIIPNHF